MNAVSLVGWSFLLLRSEESECVLCYVGWLCPAADHWGSEKRKIGQVCPAQKACVEESERMLPCLFIVVRGRNHSIFMKFKLL